MLTASVFVPYLTIYPMGPLFFLTLGLAAAFHEREAVSVSADTPPSTETEGQLKR
jgi:hypothetical protein